MQTQRQVRGIKNSDAKLDTNDQLVAAAKESQIKYDSQTKDSSNLQEKETKSSQLDVDIIDNADDWNAGGAGRTIGVGETGAANDAASYRQQMHNKWELEKKLSKRISTLEKRLQEKIVECDDAQVTFLII